MFTLKAAAAHARLAALDSSQAVIEFSSDGTILTANTNFLDLLGYTLQDARGRHHSMFVDRVESQSASYQEFWAALARGEVQTREFRRIAKGGREVWIQASYNPVRDRRGRVSKVIKIAFDITSQKLRNLDMTGQIAALNRSQAVITFAPNGTTLAGCCRSR